MTVPPPALEALRASGVGDAAAAAWAAAAPRLNGRLEDDARATTAYLTAGERLVDRLPPRPRRDERERAAAEALLAELHDTRDRFLRAHAEDVYAALTDDFATPVRVEALVEAAARRFPGLAPTAGRVAAERERRQGDKDGVEIAQGLLLSHVLASPRAGAHLVWAMLRPTRGGARPPRRVPRRRRAGPRRGARAPRGARRRRRAAQSAPPQRRGRHDDRRPPRSPSTCSCSTPTSRSA